MASKNIKRLFCLTVSLLTLLLGACASTQNDKPRGSSGPDARSSGQDAAWAAMRHRHRREKAESETPVTYDDVWDRIRDGFRFPELDSPHVDYYVEWYSERPEYMERMTNRASRYLYHIVEELERNDFPMEIALLPAIESAYRPTAYSHAHASGMWQFISATGRRYGLKQNWWYDGRRDVISATEAAIAYLSFLRDEFDGNWFHALAAYNAGERRVQREILSNRRQGKPAGYAHLNLRRETERYVPKLLAVKRIIADPERYGVTLKRIPNEPYFTIVDTGSQIDLSIVAEAAGISTAELQDLNPGFRRWATSFRSPRREWLSFLWVLKCSVRAAMRLDRMATWTSGDPVSPSLVPNSLMTRCFSSAVIDIVVSFFQKGDGASRDVVQQGPWRWSGSRRPWPNGTGCAHIGDHCRKGKGLYRSGVKGVIGSLGTVVARRDMFSSI